MKPREGLNPNWLLTELPQMRQVSSLSLGSLHCEDKGPPLLGALNEVGAVHSFAENVSVFPTPEPHSSSGRAEHSLMNHYPHLYSKKLGHREASGLSVPTFSVPPPDTQAAPVPHSCGKGKYLAQEHLLLE